MSTFCEYFDTDRCRSCEWLELPYPAQVARKERELRDRLGRALRLGSAEELPLEAAGVSRLQGFRNRAKLAVTGTAREPVLGLLGPPAALDRGQELLSCPIHHPGLNAALSALASWLPGTAIEPYLIAERRGELKAVIAFHDEVTGETYIRLVLRSTAAIPILRGRLKELLAAAPGLVCVSANIQPVPHAILEGPEEEFLTERQFIWHALAGGTRIRLSPRGFVQTNSSVASLLYAQAALWVEEALSQDRKMLELYCGQGAFSLVCGPQVGQGLGIEVNAAAVSEARENARLLGLGHLDFRCADVTAGGPVGMAEELAAFAPELVLVNPPRRGLGPKGVELVLSHRPPHLIYSSCDSETLAKDLAGGLRDFYRMRRARLFDLFPHSPHFETLAWLERTV